MIRSVKHYLVGWHSKMMSNRSERERSRQYSLRFLLLFTYFGGVLLGLLVKWATAPPPSPSHDGWFELPWMIRVAFGAAAYDALTVGLTFAGMVGFCFLCVRQITRTPRLLSVCLFTFLFPITLVVLFSPRSVVFLYQAARPALELLIAIVVGCIIETHTLGVWRKHWATVGCAAIVTAALWLFVLAFVSGI